MKVEASLTKRLAELAQQEDFTDFFTEFLHVFSMFAFVLFISSMKSGWYFINRSLYLALGRCYLLA